MVKKKGLHIQLLLPLIVCYVCVVIALSSFGYYSIHKDIVNTLVQSYYGDLFNTTRELESLFASIRNEVRLLSEHPLITDRDDSSYTSFLDADPAVFVYRYSEKEKAVIMALSAYRRYNSSVNSVYMGRENGSFVRSHPRSSPTRFDPRTRPWYRLAVATPGIPVHTEAYASVTSTDVNIGTVLALQDETGAVYGVVGMDITLDELSRRLNAKLLLYEGYLELWDANGKVLASPDSNRLFMNGDDSRYRAVSSWHYMKVDSNGSFYRFGLPVSQPVGMLAAFVPQVRIRQEVCARLAEKVILVSLIFAVVFIVIVLSVRHAVIVPLKEISRTLHAPDCSCRTDRLSVAAGKEIAGIEEQYNVLLSRMESEKEELRKLRLVILSALADLSWKRDSEKGFNIVKSQKYMDILASAHMVLYPDSLLSADDITTLVQFAPLYDIGKIVIPDHILGKPGGLTPEEFEEIKRHTSYGKEAVERAAKEIGPGDAQMMQKLVQMIYSHHEHWDGSGYPEGLSGSSIPLNARLMAIIDVYTALTSDRSYRKAFTHEAAVALIAKGSGTWFDPDLVDTFLTVEKRFLEVSLLYR